MWSNLENGGQGRCNTAILFLTQTTAWLLTSVDIKHIYIPNKQQDFCDEKNFYEKTPVLSITSEESCVKKTLQTKTFLFCITLMRENLLVLSLKNTVVTEATLPNRAHFCHVDTVCGTVSNWWQNSLNNWFCIH